MFEQLAERPVQLDGRTDLVSWSFEPSSAEHMVTLDGGYFGGMTLYIGPNGRAARDAYDHPALYGPTEWDEPLVAGIVERIGWYGADSGDCPL